MERSQATPDEGPEVAEGLVERIDGFAEEELGRDLAYPANADVGAPGTPANIYGAVAARVTTPDDGYALAGEGAVMLVVVAVSR